jgi:YrbI family 3-deoxy-D-manno-octulosonate 8-phosphate phosphatase
LGLDRLRLLDIRLLIVSTEVNPVVSIRAKKLKLECLQGIANKSIAILEWASLNNLDLSRTVFLGNDINDIEAFKVVGFPIAVGDCYHEIKPYVKYMLTRFGGTGAVRELCDLIHNDYLQSSYPLMS